MLSGISTRMRELVADRVPFVHAVVVRAHFPTAVSAGDDAIVLPDGSIEGFVGGQCAESSVRTAALGALRDGRSVLLRVLPEGELNFPDSPGAQVVVNPCLSGGALEIFLQPLLPSPVVWIVGRSPIAEALAELARPLDFAVRRAADGQGPAGATAVVVSSHGRDEIAAIRAALDAGVEYIGLVASHRRGTAVLAEMELTEAERRRVRSPVGLQIGARTAPEIALSILAEIVAAIRTGGLTPAAPTSSGSGHIAPGPPDGGPTTGSSVRAVDPVCGMTVTVSPDTPHLTVDGEDVWFCGPGCRQRYAEKGPLPQAGTGAAS
ncbi:xanthine dehydrogenase accessory factor [Streptosporangium subroseum]|uniref:Xanthine dehydrogenase accessory factor n=2 Tax=Streptosporangium subroseum TaxID=106412 RepID=A0A239DS88_9ACTN|nr:xanthine dehydrogenase accessory factor [Streptosporangium subroseum]